MNSKDYSQNLPVRNHSLQNQPIQALPIQDRLVLFGYGLFETIRVEGHGPTCLERHYQRMQQGALSLGLDIPHFSDWQKLIQSYLDENPTPPPPYALRLTLSGGSSQLPSRILFHTRTISYTPAHYAHGVGVNFLSAPRNEFSPLCSLKTTNYLENILAREEAQRAGFFEGLWCNTQGFLAEGTMSNLFFVQAGELHTPSLSCGCLPGTRRELVLELAASLGIPIHEGKFNPSDLEHVNEVFLTNALMGIMPVNQVGEFRFPVALEDGELITRRLEKALTETLGRSLASMPIQQGF